MPKIKVKRFKQESAHRQTDTHTRTHGRYQTYYLHCYSVDNKEGCSFLGPQCMCIVKLDAYRWSPKRRRHCLPNDCRPTGLLDCYPHLGWHIRPNVRHDGCKSPAYNPNRNTIPNTNPTYPNLNSTNLFERLAKNYLDRWQSRVKHEF